MELPRVYRHFCSAILYRPLVSCFKAFTWTSGEKKSIIILPICVSSIYSCSQTICLLPLIIHLVLLTCTLYSSVIYVHKFPIQLRRTREGPRSWDNSKHGGETKKYI